MIPPQMRAAIAAAEAAGLEVTQDIKFGRQNLTLLSPSLGQSERVRLHAWRVLEPHDLACHSLALGLEVEVLSRPSGAWTPLRERIQVDDKDVLIPLFAQWYPAVLRFLHHDDPAVLEEESDQSPPQKISDITSWLNNRRIRRDLRIFGRIEHGDLCLSVSGDTRSAPRAGPLHIFRRTDRQPHGQHMLMHVAAFLPNGRTQDIVFSSSPAIYPYLRKLGPQSLSLLAPGIVNAHQRMRLLAHQDALDTARAEGLVTRDFIDRHWGLAPLFS